MALARGRRGYAAELAERGQHVEQVAHGLGPLVPGDAWTADDERHADRVLVEVLLADQPVAAARHARVGGVDDDGVGGMRRRSSASSTRPTCASR